MYRNYKCGASEPTQNDQISFNIDDHHDLILFCFFIHSFHLVQPQNTLKITVSHHKTAATFTATDALKRKSPNDDRGFTFLFIFILMIVNAIYFEMLICIWKSLFIYNFIQSPFSAQTNLLTQNHWIGNECWSKLESIVASVVKLGESDWG